MVKQKDRHNFTCFVWYWNIIFDTKNCLQLWFSRWWFNPPPPPNPLCMPLHVGLALSDVSIYSLIIVVIFTFHLVYSKLGLRKC